MESTNETTMVTNENTKVNVVEQKPSWLARHKKGLIIGGVAVVVIGTLAACYFVGTKTVESVGEAVLNA